MTQVHATDDGPGEKEPWIADVQAWAISFPVQAFHSTRLGVGRYAYPVH